MSKEISAFVKAFAVCFVIVILSAINSEPYPAYPFLNGLISGSILYFVFYLK